MSGYNTNLAAEFHVLSMLHRRGISAYLTLGNKKGVDVVVAEPGELTTTVEVKGVAGAHDWPADNVQAFDRLRHFYALVSFEGRIEDPTSCPTVWIIPSTAIRDLIRRYRTRSVISRKAVVTTASECRHAWDSIIAPTA